MNTQALTGPVMTCNFVVALPETEKISPEPIYASTRDYGFDFDEEELGKELLAPLHADSASSIIHEVDADEFEQVFQYFLS